jgi:hypothetical protein
VKHHSYALRKVDSILKMFKAQLGTDKLPTSSCIYTFLENIHCEMMLAAYAWYTTWYITLRDARDPALSILPREFREAADRTLSSALSQLMEILGLDSLVQLVTEAPDGNSVVAKAAELFLHDSFALMLNFGATLGDITPRDLFASFESHDPRYREYIEAQMKSEKEAIRNLMDLSIVSNLPDYFALTTASKYDLERPMFEYESGRIDSLLKSPRWKGGWISVHGNTLGSDQLQWIHIPSTNVSHIPIALKLSN